MKFVKFKGLMLVLVVLCLSYTKPNIKQFNANKIEGVYEVHALKMYLISSHEPIEGIKKTISLRRRFK